MNIKNIPAKIRRNTRAVVLFTICMLLALGSLLVPTRYATALESTITSWQLGDFESGGALQPPGWKTNSLQGDVRAVASTSRVISGTRSLQVEDNSTTQAAWAESEPISVTATSTYIFQAYVYTSRGAGEQNITVRFHDQAGTIIDSASASTTAAEMMWNRVMIKTAAPAGAVRATLRIASTTSGTGTAWWDTIDYLRPIFYNGQFENTPANSTDVPWWSVDRKGGTVKTTTDQRYVRAGNRALHIVDTSTTGAPKVVSNGRKATGGDTYMPRVFPGVVHDFTGWVLPISGTPKLVVTWYDAQKQFISSSYSRVLKPAGEWAYYKAQLAAPYNAQYATLTLTGEDAGTSEAYWDEMQISPTAPSPIPTYSTRSLGSPLHEAANTKTTDTLMLNGRATIYAGVSGNPANLQLIDIESNQLKANVPIPNTDSVFCATNTSDGAIYVSGGDGHLYRWEQGVETLADLGKMTTNGTTIVSLTTDSNGIIWGGTSPQAEVFSYNPSTESHTDYGSIDSTETYARSIAVTTSGVYVGTGPTNPRLIHLDPSTHNKTPIPLPSGLASKFVYELKTLGNYLSVKGDSNKPYRLYDWVNGTWPNMPVNAGGGALDNQQPMPLAASTGEFYYTSYRQILGVDGETLATTKRADAPEALYYSKRDISLLVGSIEGIPSEWIILHDQSGSIVAMNTADFSVKTFAVTWQATPMRIKSIAAGVNGKMFVGGFGGASLAIINPSTGTGSQYPENPDNTLDQTIGEIEGSIENSGYQFMGSYTGGKIFRYNPAQEWVDGSNPVMIAKTSDSGQDRPIAWAKSGTRTFFGTVPTYGQLTGALGIIDTPTASPRLVTLVADQSIVSLAAKGDVVFYGTSRWGGYGATPTTSTAKIGAYDVVKNKKVWEVEPQAGTQTIGSLTIAPNGNIWATAGWNLYEVGPNSGTILRRVSLRSDAQPNNTVQWNDTKMAFIGSRLYLTIGTDTYSIDTTNLHVDKILGKTSTNQVSAVLNGKLYYASGTELIEVTPSNATVPTTATNPYRLDRCGTANDFYVIPYTPGVNYYVNGAKIDTGNYAAGSSVTITARPQNGWRLNGITTWTLTFTNSTC